MKDGQNNLQLAIPLNASGIDKVCKLLFQRYGPLCLRGTMFSLMQPQT